MTDNKAKKGTIKIATVVVTYNRLELLKENLKAVLDQTVDSDILLIDNASTDGTKEYVESLKNDRIGYYNTGKNIGGAGGFSAGVRLAIEGGYDYAWLMDDDSIPEADALESLVKKAAVLKNQFSFLSSLVRWTDGSIAKMNVQEARDFGDLDLLDHERLLTIRRCSFVGCFVNLSLAKKEALPIADFFIYGDDVEYTRRIQKDVPAYLDLDSVIVHKMGANEGTDIITIPAEKVERYYYDRRNSMYMAKVKGIMPLLREIRDDIKLSRRIGKEAADNKALRKKMLRTGAVAGLFFKPHIEYANINE
ncbi:Glycosyltransferase, GT2 family [Lachnospiraceae bacterium]|nr:Glycosyltransferase, GT2 family [Lachnospiraceae bacterium]